MGRKQSILAETWWDYTTLDEEILRDAARLSAKDLLALSRPGFRVVFYDTLESFYMNEALEYISAWRTGHPLAAGGYLRTHRADGTVAPGRRAGEQSRHIPA